MGGAPGLVLERQARNVNARHRTATRAREQVVDGLERIRMTLCDSRLLLQGLVCYIIVTHVVSLQFLVRFVFLASTPQALPPRPPRYPVTMRLDGLPLDLISIRRLYDRRVGNS